MQAEKSRIIAKFNPAKQNTTSEPEPQPRYYADPDLLNEKCRQLENIPFVLVEEESRSKSSEKRIEQLELELRKASKEKRRPNIELDSTILLGPLMGGWPQIDLEEESDVEYPLVETEEEWFEWKEKIDKKRAQKLQASSHLPKDGKVMSSTRPKKLLEQPVAKKAIDLPSTSLQILQDYADEKENEFNRIIQEVATESQWNEDSIARAFQSTQVDEEPLASVEFVPTPQTPPTQLATPPDSRLHLREGASLPELQTPSRPHGGKREKGSQSVSGASLYSQSMGTRTKAHAREPHAISHRTPHSPETPTSSSMAHRTPLASHSNGSAQTRQNVDGWRKQAAHAHPSSQQPPSPQRSIEQYSQDRIPFPSPSTTHYLYGSQKSTGVGSQRNRSNSYTRELDQELERELQIFDMNKAVDANNGPRRTSTTSTNAWTGGSYEEDTEFKSQEARAISSFVENDLGDPYRDEPYAAINQHKYENPYDDY